MLTLKGTTRRQSFETLLESLKKEVLLLESYFVPDKFTHHNDKPEEIKYSAENCIKNAKKFIAELNFFKRESFYQTNKTEIESLTSKVEDMEKKLIKLKKPYEKRGEPVQYAKQLERHTTEELRREISEIRKNKEKDDESKLEENLYASKGFAKKPNAYILENKRQRGDFKPLLQPTESMLDYGLSFLPGYNVFKRCISANRSEDNLLVEGNMGIKKPINNQ